MSTALVIQTSVIIVIANIVGPALLAWLIWFFVGVFNLFKEECQSWKDVAVILFFGISMLTSLFFLVTE